MRISENLEECRETGEPRRTRVRKRDVLEAFYYLISVVGWLEIGNLGGNRILEVGDAGSIAHTLHAVVSLTAVKWLPLLSALGLASQRWEGFSRHYLVFHTIIVVNALSYIAMEKGVF